MKEFFISFEVKMEIPVSTTPIENGFNFVQYKSVWSKVKPRKHYVGASLDRYIAHLKDDESTGKVRNVLIKEIS